MDATIALAVDERADELRVLMERLNERHRRWVAGLLASVLPYGGNSCVVRVTGLDHKTVAKGKAEFESKLKDYPDDDRVRKPGGGRPRVEKKRPTSSNNSKTLSSPKPAVTQKDESATSAAA